MTQTVDLEWERFDRLTQAREQFGHSSCVYVQADCDGHALRVGMASRGLHSRYRGGTGWAIDAAMHQSRNVIFVAGVSLEHLARVETTLIWTYREVLIYNQIGKLTLPTELLGCGRWGDAG